jgi:calcium-dependent protein kinase
MTSDEDKESLLETFKAIDENGDGMISRKELLTGYRKVNDVQISDDELNDMFSRIDKDNNGKIDYSEFVSASINR